MSFANDNVLTVKTIQVSIIRTLMTALKDILLESNIVFQPDGIRITNTDKTHTILVHLFLDATKFEFYECKYPKIVICANIINLHRLINASDAGDTLTMYIEKNDYKDGSVDHLSLKFENGDIKQCKIHKLFLNELDPEEIEYPVISYSSVINMPSSDFQKIIRDLTALGEKLVITSVSNELIFKCHGKFSHTEIHRGERDSSMEFVTKPAGKIVQGEYSLKHLNSFVKCTNLCGQVELYLENDLPLIVKYNVASLGIIKLCSNTLPGEHAESL